MVFWTWRPSGSRYFARHTDWRFRSTRKTCPEIPRAGRVGAGSYADLGTHSEQNSPAFRSTLVKKVAIYRLFSTPPPGFEPGTCGLEVRCSIQLSYGGSRDSVRALGSRAPGRRRGPPADRGARRRPSPAFRRSAWEPPRIW